MKAMKPALHGPCATGKTSFLPHLKPGIGRQFNGISLSGPSQKKSSRRQPAVIMAADFHRHTQMILAANERE
jgi:hypothetical protein